MYSDADKRREASRERMRKYRSLKKGVTVTPDDVTPNVTPKDVTPVTPSVTPEFVEGMGNWVKLRGGVKVPAKIEIPKRNYMEVRHHATCHCLMCRQPK